MNVAGYFRAELGAGEAARLLVAALRAAEIPYSVVPYGFTASRQKHPFADRGTGAPIYDTNIICVNANELPRFVERAGREFLDGRYTIGMWMWEVEEFPEPMRWAAHLVDEIWVASRYTAAAIAPVVSKPVLSFPLPVVAPRALPLSRAALGLPDGFLFLFCFDFYSVAERKNPLAVVEAFAKAFMPGEGPVLVIKTINGRAYPHALQCLRAAVDRPDVHLIDAYWMADEQHALIHACDAYVSLHRAEGFGLTMAEAMALGKPVIATGYSGNLEFMDERNSYLVPYELVSIPPGCEPYPTGASWAEPDVRAAARLMRHVYSNPADARAKAERARGEMLSHHGPEARAAFLRDRLETLAASRPVSVAPESLPPLERAAFYLMRGPDIASRRGWVRLIRRLAQRGLRPYTDYQRQLAQALLQAIREVDARSGPPGAANGPRSESEP